MGASYPRHIAFVCRAMRLIEEDSRKYRSKHVVTLPQGFNTHTLLVIKAPERLLDAYDAGQLAKSQGATYAARHGNLTLLKCARAYGAPWIDTSVHRDYINSEVCTAAAAGGHRHIIEWSRAQGCGWSTTTCAAAAAGGHLELLKWLREQDCPWSYFTAFYAVKAGHTHILQWALTKGCPSDAAVCHAAIVAGRFDMLQWLHNTKFDVGLTVCFYAARRGNVELLEWASAQGYCWWPRQAALSLPQAVNPARRPPQISFTDCAAEDGHLDAVKWAVANGCTWDAKTAIKASRKGHLCVLQWAVAHGHQWDPHECLEAASRHAVLRDWIEAQIVSMLPSPPL